jgi:hypothetical protein
MAADSEKRKVTIEATEPEVVTISINNPTTTFTLCQCCLLCDNTRPFVNGYPPGPSPWVCDECKEAIAFVKKQLKHDPLKPILD